MPGVSGEVVPHSAEPERASGTKSSRGIERSDNFPLGGVKVCHENHVAVHPGHPIGALLAVGGDGACGAAARRADEKYVLGHAFRDDLVVDRDVVDLSDAVGEVAEPRAGDDDHQDEKRDPGAGEDLAEGAAC